MECNSICLKPINCSFDKQELLDILYYKEDDIVFISGSLIEGCYSNLSKGMGNKYSDIDVFIISNDYKNLPKDIMDYDFTQTKTQFKVLHGINIDIEIYDRQIINQVITEINKINFSIANKRTVNLLNLPNGYDLNKVTSFLHRLLVGVPIYNNSEFDKCLSSIKKDHYFKFMKRLFINNIDNYYEDVIGNLDNNQLEVAVAISRQMLLNAIRVYLYKNRSSIDREKWIILKMKNLAEESTEANKIYTRFYELYFNIQLNDSTSLYKNAEDSLELINKVIELSCDEEGV